MLGIWARRVLVGLVLGQADEDVLELDDAAYRNKDPRRFYFNRLKQIQKLEQRLQNTINYNCDFVKFSERIENALKILQAERLAVKARIKVMNKPRWRRLPHVLATWASEHYRFFQGWKSALIDLIRL